MTGTIAAGLLILVTYFIIPSRKIKLLLQPSQVSLLRL